MLWLWLQSTYIKRKLLHDFCRHVLSQDQLLALENWLEKLWFNGEKDGMRILEFKSPHHKVYGMALSTLLISTQILLEIAIFLCCPIPSSLLADTFHWVPQSIHIILYGDIIVVQTKRSAIFLLLLGLHSWNWMGHKSKWMKRWIVDIYQSEAQLPNIQWFQGHKSKLAVHIICLFLLIAIGSLQNWQKSNVKSS